MTGMDDRVKMKLNGSEVIGDLEFGTNKHIVAIVNWNDPSKVALSRGFSGDPLVLLNFVKKEIMGSTGKRFFCLFSNSFGDARVLINYLERRFSFDVNLARNDGSFRIIEKNKNFEKKNDEDDLEKNNKQYKIRRDNFVGVFYDFKLSCFSSKSGKSSFLKINFPVDIVPRTIADIKLEYSMKLKKSPEENQGINREFVTEFDNLERDKIVRELIAGVHSSLTSDSFSDESKI